MNPSLSSLLLSLLPNHALQAAQGPSMQACAHQPIGVFDSGMGGLSVWQDLCAVLPRERYIYVADNAHVPYGDKSPEWIQQRMVVFTEWFLAQGCKTIVWACNTATAAGVTYLRQLYPEVFFVGLEPAIKPAMRLTKTGKVAMLATHATVHSEKYRALVARTMADNHEVELRSIACVGWAQAIDQGQMDDEHGSALLHRYLDPVQQWGADVVVLGCTHYPFIASHIAAILGETVLIIDSGAPVARYTEKILSLRQGLNHSNPLLGPKTTEFYATHCDASVQARWRWFADLPTPRVLPLAL